MVRHKIADLHCHSNLKAFGYAFSGLSENGYNRQHVWYYDPPGIFSKIVNSVIGLANFRQSDFTSLAKGSVKIALVSLYPLEKGFFIGDPWKRQLLTKLGTIACGVSTERIKQLQLHADYYQDLQTEYTFFENSCKEFEVEGEKYSWKFANSWADIEAILDTENVIAVVPTIEGAHVFNTGLHLFGKECNENEVLGNIDKMKQWRCPPFFITLAHNFNNGLCGHARSLERLGGLVNQTENIDTGFTHLGLEVLRSLLSSDNGRPVYVDIKHMSLCSRKAYFELIDSDYCGKVPVIVSHGAVTGLSMAGKQNIPYKKNIFIENDINFFDEEVVSIARSNGIFALQLDASRLAAPKYLQKSLRNVFSGNGISDSAFVVWLQLQHIAEILDQHGLFSWGCVSIGSDFDGGINPLNGVWTAENLPGLADELLVHASRYLKNVNRLTLKENKTITAEEIVERFVFRNAVQFLKRHYRAEKANRQRMDYKERASRQWVKEER